MIRRRLPITGVLPCVLAAWLLCAPVVQAQVVVHSNEILASVRPEAWAMRYVAASTLMTAFGQTPALPEWRLGVALDAGYIPKLSEQQQRIGLHGVKQEDLNRSPVFGRLRLLLGLPGEFVATVGYTPPLTFNNTQAHDLVAVSIGRRLLENENFSLSFQLFGQHGRANGDVTCPGRLAGVTDPQRNPYGSQAPSDDHISLNYYGAELTAAWTIDAWHAHASFGDVRTEFAVQVDALTFSVRDRSYLTSRGSMPYATLGASRDLDAHWNLGVEVLYVPVRVQREINGPVDNDPLTSVRVQLMYRFD